MDMGRLVITRQSSPGWALKEKLTWISIKIDGQKKGSLRAGESLVIDVPAGPHTVDFVRIGERVSLVVDVLNNQNCELYTTLNCACEISGKWLYASDRALVRGPRCSLHMQGVYDCLWGWVVGFLFWFGTILCGLTFANIHSAVSHHSFELLKLVTQLYLLSLARSFFVDNAMSLPEVLVLRAMVLGYCLTVAWFVWHITRNQRLGRTGRLFWYMFTISASAMFALVIPAAVYGYKYIFSSSKKRVFAAAILTSTAAVLCSLLLSPLNLEPWARGLSYEPSPVVLRVLFDTYITGSVLFILLFPFLYSEKAWVWLSECFVPRARRMLMRLCAAKTNLEPIAATATEQPVRHSPDVVLAASTPVNSAKDADEKESITQIAMNTATDGATIELSEKITEFRS
jgi:hypothetical protein